MAGLPVMGLTYAARTRAGGHSHGQLTDRWRGAARHLCAPVRERPRRRDDRARRDGHTDTQGGQRRTTTGLGGFDKVLVLDAVLAWDSNVDVIAVDVHLALFIESAERR
jgi:hypothetical protein